MHAHTIMGLCGMILIVVVVVVVIVVVLGKGERERQCSRCYMIADDDGEGIELSRRYCHCIVLYILSTLVRWRITTVVTTYRYRTVVGLYGSRTRRHCLSSSMMMMMIMIGEETDLIISSVHCLYLLLLLFLWSGVYHSFK